MLTHGTTTDVPMRDIATTTPAEFAAASFIAGYSNAKTREAYTMHLRDWFQFLASADVDPMAAQRVHGDLWMRSLEARDLMPRTRALKLTAVRSFYRYCVDEDWLEISPADRVKRPMIERKSPRGALTRTQAFDLLEGAAQISVTAHAVTRLLCMNGTRIGETCAANVDDFVYERHDPVLLLPERKGGKSGDAPLSRELEHLIIDCIGGRRSGPIFVNNYGNRLTRHNAQTILDRAMRNVRGQHPRVTPHVLRHTWVTLAVAAGADPERIQHDGGWADSRLVGYYCHTEHRPASAVTHLVSAYTSSAA